MRCDPEVREWKGRPLYVCQGCGVRTVDKGVFAGRCRSRATPSPSPVTSTAGLYGPDDRPLPKPDPEPAEPVSHDDLSPDVQPWASEPTHDTQEE